MARGTGSTPAAERRTDPTMGRKIRTSLLVILVPILTGPAIAIVSHKYDWPWFTYPVIWAVGLIWVWRPRRSIG
jgi:hypothetical protein